MSILANAQRKELLFSAAGVGAGVGAGEVVRSRYLPSECLSLLNFNSSSAGSYARKITFDGTHFVIGSYRFGASYITYSSNGVTWNNGLSGVTTLEGYTVSSDGAGLLLACTGTASANNIVRSTDHGVTWQASGSVPELISYYTLGYGNGVWIAVETGNGQKTARSLDGGLTWSIGGTLPNSTSNGWSTLIRMQNGIWVLSGAYNSITLVSYDEGVSWKVGGGAASSNGAMAYNASTGMLVRGASGGTYPLTLSFNGVDWVVIGSNNTIQDSLGSMGKYVAYFDVSRLQIVVIDASLNRYTLKNTQYQTSWSVLFAEGGGNYVIATAGADTSPIYAFTGFANSPNTAITS